MGTINGVTVDVLHGSPPNKKERVETWQVPGIAGYGARKLGPGEATFRLVAIRYGSEATVDSWLSAIESAQGSVVTIVDDHGDSFTSCLITSVQRSPTSKIRAETGTTTHRGELVVLGVRR